MEKADRTALNVGRKKVIARMPDPYNTDIPELVDRAHQRAIAIGGQILMDDLAPVEMWPDAWTGMRDHKREFCLCNPRLAGAEVRTSATTVSVIGTRLQ